MSTSRPPEEGRELAEGRYRLLAKLGEGGMGAVFRATDQRLEREVVIKVLRAALLAEPELAERFRAEMLSLVQLEHPNIVKLFDFGEQDGQSFAVMQYLAGGSLRDRQPHGPQGPAPMPLARLTTWLPQVAAALDFIHQQGYVHRDVKPDNILFDSRGHVYVSDFGIAKILAQGALRRQQNVSTQAGMLLGTPHYMAPELIMGEPYDGRADQYALAVLVYELLSGRRPFESASATGVLVQQTTKVAPLLNTLDPTIPQGTAHAVARALAKRPEERFPDCTSFAHAVLKGVGQKTRGDLPAVAPPPAPPEGTHVADRPSTGVQVPQPPPTLAPQTRPAARPPSGFWAWLRARFRNWTKREATTPPIPPALSTPPRITTQPPKIPPTPPPMAVAPEPEDEPPRPAPADVSLLMTAGPLHRPFGNYELLRRLGQGETGVVYLARHREQGWQTALKILPGARFTRPEVLQRLLREARVGAGLRHPSVCQILDAGSADGEFYLAMEYVEGQTLQARLREAKGPLPLPLACYYAAQLFDTLHYLARQGVVHRDVKPGNLMIGAGDRLKVMDLALAKSLDSDADAALTGAGVFLGTPAYVAPEQIRDARTATAQSDLYAAGVTLYEMVTGTTPFRGTNPMEVIHKVLHEPPADPRHHRAEVPEPLARLLLQLLAKEPGERPDHDTILAVVGAAQPGIPQPQPSQGPRPAPASLVVRIDQAGQQLQKATADDLVSLLPTEEGRPCLGNYFLEEPLGPPGGVRTFRGRHFATGETVILRLLPLAFSQLEPERLRGLLRQRARLKRVSERSPFLAKLVDIGKTQLRGGAFTSLYYLVEGCVPGRTLKQRIAAGELLAPAVAETCLTQALRGLHSLHRRRLLHGNLHPGKVYYDASKGRLRLADLSCAREPAAAALVTEAATVNGSDPATPRQYTAPELLGDEGNPGPLAEQYALGVLFVEALAGRFLRTHPNVARLPMVVQEDLQDCLFSLAEQAPRLGRVLRRMVAINPRTRFPDMQAVLGALTPDPAPPPPARAPVPPAAGESVRPYDLFLSYRRESGAETARVIRERLSHDALHAFLDVDSLRSGHFDEHLLTVIENAPNFVVILSEDSLERCKEETDWLRREIAHALRKNRNVVPVLMPGFRMPLAAELPADIAALTRFNGVPYAHDYFDEFIKKLKTFLKPRAGAS